MLYFIVFRHPTKEIDANLLAISKLKESFNCVIGHSDHTNGIKVPLLAVAAGAQVIEKHFKIDQTMDCVDESVPITELQLRELVQGIREIEDIFGNGFLELLMFKKK